MRQIKNGDMYKEDMSRSPLSVKKNRGYLPGVHVPGQGLAKTPLMDYSLLNKTNMEVPS